MDVQTSDLKFTTEQMSKSWYDVDMHGLPIATS